MTGLKIKRVLARMDKVVPGRKLDDNDFVMAEFENGATGHWSSQIAIGTTTACASAFMATAAQSSGSRKSRRRSPSSRRMAR